MVMVTLTNDAQSHLDRYLRQMRAALRGHRSVDPDEIERDVFGHIDAELAGQPEPVDERDLQRVLDRLGAPSQWAPVEELSPWWGVISSLRHGPEDWRLAYLALGLASLGVALFIGGPFLWPLPALLPVVAFFLARATIELLHHHEEPLGARRWLIYPVVLPWYIGLAALLLLWPVALVGGVTQDVPALREWIGRSISEPVEVITALVAAVAVGLWWACLGLILRRYPSALSGTFRPFLESFDRRRAWGVVCAGLLLAAAAGSILAALA